MSTVKLRLLFIAILLVFGDLSHAGALRERIKEYRADTTEDVQTQMIRDVAYGNAAAQHMDVYLPGQATSAAPVIFMVHGGGWRLGDKANAPVVKHKVAYWLAKGFIFISINYRLLPEAKPLQQAEDVARALATAQSKAVEWGADPAKFIVMGHSAGAHLVALLAAKPSSALALGAKPWLGTILLDSAALNVEQLMRVRHLPLYDRAFGQDSESWRVVSPYHVLAEQATPILAVCASSRQESCAQAQQFVNKANALNVQASVIQQDLSHGEINEQLGVAGAYTEAVAVYIDKWLSQSTNH